MSREAAALWFRRRRLGGPSGPTYSIAESAAQLPNSAVGIITSGVTQAGTITQWSAVYGGKAANVTLTPPAGTNEPAYNASAGPGGGPAAVFDGTNDVLRSAAVTAWGYSLASFSIDVWGLLAGAETAGDCLARYTGGDNITLAVTAAPAGRIATAGTGGATTNGTTTLTGTHRRMQATGISGASGTQSVLVNGVAEGTAAITHAAWTDAGPFSIGAAPAGTTPVALTCVAWALTFGSSAAAALSPTEDAYLQALVAHYVVGLV